MNAKYRREDLLKELEWALDIAGPNPVRWPKGCCARLSAFVESDDEAARLYAEHKALDRVLGCAPEGAARSEIETCILKAAFGLKQERAQPSGFEVRLAGGGGTRHRMRPVLFRAPRRALWGEAVLLAASLALGVYIGISGEAVHTLRTIDVMASNDREAGLALSGSLFEPSGLYDQEQL